VALDMLTKRKGGTAHRIHKELMRIEREGSAVKLKTFLEIVVDKNENAIHNTMKKSCEFVEKANHQLRRNYKIFKDNQGRVAQ
jgi:hypothetical protein